MQSEMAAFFIFLLFIIFLSVLFFMKKDNKTLNILRNG